MPISQQSDDSLVISVKEARKLLGHSGKKMPDSQIVELIVQLTSMADDFLQDIGSTNYNSQYHAT